MQVTIKRGKIMPVSNGYVFCPECRRRQIRAKLIQILPETTAHELHLFCRHCKTEYIVNIEKGQCFESQCR